MKLISAASGIALVSALAAGASAQTATTKVETKNKVKVEDGKEVTTLGCLERNPSGGYMLIDSATGGMRYALVTDDDLSKHVGHTVQVTGKATDMGDAKVRVETETKGTSGSDKDKDKSKTKSKTEAKGDLGLRYLGMKSLKMISTTCR